MAAYGEVDLALWLEAPTRRRSTERFAIKMQHALQATTNTLTPFIEKEQQQGQPANESELFPQPSVRQALGMANPNAKAQKSPPIEGTECIEEAPSAAEDITNGFGILNLLEQNNEMLEKAPAGVENNDLDTNGWSHQHCVS